MKKVFKLFRIFIILIAGLIATLVLYLSFAFILSVIPANSGYTEPEEGIEIYLQSNGVHTDIVLPVKNAYKDWTKEISFEHTLSKDSLMNFIAFGWGDKGFYLETETWDELKFSTAFKAMFFLSSTAMHVSFSKDIITNDYCKKIKISEETYRKLVKIIEKSFQRNNKEQLIPLMGHYYEQNDVFYEAKGTYNLFYTCNTWTNEVLKQSGLKSCLWSPFDKGILYQYR